MVVNLEDCNIQEECSTDGNLRDDNFWGEWAFSYDVLTEIDLCFWGFFWTRIRGVGSTGNWWFCNILLGANVLWLLMVWWTTVGYTLFVAFSKNLESSLDLVLNSNAFLASTFGWIISIFFIHGFFFEIVEVLEDYTTDGL